MLTDQQVLDLAIKHEKTAGNASASVCLYDAKGLMERGMGDHARSRALRSLAHSVGIFHRDYERALHGEKEYQNG